MIKLLEKPTKTEILEVGDLLVTSHGTRLVVYSCGQYLAVDINNMICAHDMDSLADLHSFYNGARIIKADNIQLVEV